MLLCHVSGLQLDRRGCPPAHLQACCACSFMPNKAVSSCNALRIYSVVGSQTRIACMSLFWACERQRQSLSLSLSSAKMY